MKLYLNWQRLPNAISESMHGIVSVHADVNHTGILGKMESTFWSLETGGEPTRVENNFAACGLPYSARRACAVMKARRMTGWRLEPRANMAACWAPLSITVDTSSAPRCLLIDNFNRFLLSRSARNVGVNFNWHRGYCGYTQTCNLLQY